MSLSQLSECLNQILPKFDEIFSGNQLQYTLQNSTLTFNFQKGFHLWQPVCMGTSHCALIKEMEKRWNIR